MNRSILLFAALSVALFSILPATAITIPTVPVGNAGNMADPADGDSVTAGIQHYGAVAYNYRIGTTEVTNAQYAAFLKRQGRQRPVGPLQHEHGQRRRHHAERLQR